MTLSDEPTSPPSESGLQRPEQNRRQPNIARTELTVLLPASFAHMVRQCQSQRSICHNSLPCVVGIDCRGGSRSLSNTSTAILGLTTGGRASILLPPSQSR